MAMRSRTQLTEEAKKIADIIFSADEVLIASHIDADGISAAALASSALDRAGIKHELLFLRKLDNQSIEQLMQRSSDMLVWLTDLGSAYASHFSNDNVVITDHHQTEAEFEKIGNDKQTTLFSFSEPAHLNPHRFGYSGARDISAAGLAFLVATEMDRANNELVGLSIIGAVGDMQDNDARRLTGLNAEMVKLGVRLGKVRKALDLRLFGIETRSLPKLLEYATDPVLPGLSGNMAACEEFLKMLKVQIANESGWRHWSELVGSEKRRIITALSRHILENGGNQDSVARLMGEVYIFPEEEIGRPTREAREFATLLNSCGRNGMPQIGLELCKGDRDEALEQAFSLLRDHRENISNAIGFVRELGITSFGSIQHFHCADQVKDTIVGIIAGMLLGSGDADRSKPLVGFAISREASGEFKIKASIRGVRELVDSGLNLANAARLAAERVGGVGGGHNIAAGATIPLGSEEEFLAALERVIGEQLGAY